MPQLSPGGAPRAVIASGVSAPAARQLAECEPDGLPERIMPGAQRELLACPALLRIQPDPSCNEFLRLPLEARPYMRMQESVGVAEDLEVHSPERRVRLPARPLDRFAESVHVGQEGHPLAPRQV